MKSSLWPSVLMIIIVVSSSSSSVKSSIVNTGSSAVARSEDGHGNYIFGYDENHSTGGSFRKEKGGNGIQIGSYGLRDSDGRMRIVNYVADVNGFRASVETNEPGTINGHPDVGNKAGKITRHDNGGGTFSYSSSTEHIAPVLPQVYHHNGGGDSHISYPNYGGGGGGANYAFSKANLQVPKQNDYYSALQSFYNNYHQHLSGGYLPKPKPMSYSSSTTHIAPMVPFLPKSYPQQSPSISQTLPAFSALLPQSPLPALRPAQQILAKNQQSLVEKLTKNDPILNGYLAQQPNLQQLSGNVQPIVVKKQQQQPESPISTAQATILTSDGLSIPLSVSIHGLHKSY